MILSVGLPIAVHAAPPYFGGGTNIGYGPASDPSTAFQALANPALPGYSTKKGHIDGFGSNIFSFYGFYEIGQIDNLTDKFDELSIKLDPDNTESNSGLDAAQDVMDAANEILAEVGEDGYLQGGFVFHIPMFPMIFSGFGGALSLDASISDMGHTRLLDSPVELNNLTSLPESASSLYVKNARIFEISFGYSRFLTEVFGGELYGGLRTKLMDADFGKTIIKFDEASDDIVDDISDSLSGDNSNQSTNFGIDIGLVYEIAGVRLGATLANVNEPAFSYQTLGSNCNSKAGNEKISCNAALLFSDRITLRETHVMNQQLKMDLAWQPVSWWKVSASYDMNSINDVVGNEIQYMYIGSSFSPGVILPGIRVGLLQNMVGTELSIISLGTTLFHLLNLDIAFSEQLVEIDGTELPVSAMLNFGFELTF